MHVLVVFHASMRGKIVCGGSMLVLVLDATSFFSDARP